MNDVSSMVCPKDLVDAQLYANEQAVFQDAFRVLLRTRPQLRIRVAIYRYQHEDLSLAKAASLAGVSWAQMRDIMLDHGLQPRLGPQTMEEALDEVETLRACVTPQL